MPRSKTRKPTLTEMTPAARHFFMPAEWESHEATWIAWPHRRADWPGKLSAIPWVYGEIVRQLSQSEVVHSLVDNAKVEKTARELLVQVGAELERVVFWQFETDRVWTRDYGPIFLLGPNGKKAVLDFR